LRDLKQRFDQLLASSPLLLLRSAPGGIVELVALTAQKNNKPVLDLANEFEPLEVEKLESLREGLLWCEELSRLNRLQQKNLCFAVERLTRYQLRLVVGTIHDPINLIAQGWEEEIVKTLFGSVLGVPALTELKEEVPDIATHLLSFLIEDEALPLRRFTTGALNALRHRAWVEGYSALRAAVKSLAVAALGEEVSAEEVHQLLTPAGAPFPENQQLSLEILQQPLREARGAFERLYFLHHLAEVDGNMVRLAETTGLERTHLYRKLKDLGLR